MSKVLVYRFRTWDITSDGFRDSRRWATKEAIKRVMGEAVGEGVEVDDEYLGHEVDGMTARDFDARNLPFRDFQTRVR